MERGRPMTFIFCSFEYYYNDDDAHMFWDFLLKPQNRMHAVNDRDLGAFKFKCIKLGDGMPYQFCSGRVPRD